MECLSYCIAGKIDLNSVERRLRHQGYRLERHWRSLMLFEPKQNHYCFVFANGSIVTWNAKRHQVRTYLDLIRPFAIRPAKIISQDEFFYRVGEAMHIAPHDYFSVDCIVLESDEEELKLSLSYGFAQSIKLKYYEHFLESLASQYTPMIYALGKKHARIRRSKVRQVISQLLIAKSEMTLVEDTLYQPKFFWQHPNLEEYYLLIEKYLDIPKRVDALNQQFSTLSEVFDMLNTYLENKHASFLEIIIIILLVVEIVFSVMHLQI